MNLRTVVAALLLFRGVFGHSAPAPALAEPAAKYIVTLDGDPAAVTFARVHARQGKVVALATGRARIADLGVQHAAMIDKVRGLGVVDLGHFNKLINAISVRATAAQAEALRALPGVKGVERIRLFHTQTASSVPFIGSPQVWGGTPAADGANVRIGIIDTGIDYTHADFGGSGLVGDYTSNDGISIAPGTFPTAKVVGGWDFVGDKYDAGDPLNDTPQPDQNPLDCAGHGSHVAGIAAGFGVLTSGATYTGPYTTGLNYSQFKIGPGAAPQAKLYALKVFGCVGSVGSDVIVQALEWAADPNNDGNFSDRLDVVNLSLGSSFGLTGSGNSEQDAVNSLADLGCVPVISAGNSGETFYIVSSPSTAEKAISVACSIDSGTTTPGTSVEILSPASIVGVKSAVEGAITSPLSSSGSIQGPISYAQPNDACSVIVNGGSGKIIMIDRGTCLFADKILAAQQAGAVAVIMVNNVPSDPIIMGGVNAGITIPGVMISQADGALIKAHLAEGVVVRLADQTVHPELADQLASFSSRGPAAPVNRLKPEITAPGFSITSVDVGAGTTGVNLSGTSMSAPHVTGVAAMLRQLHPNWASEEIKAAMMNTSRQPRDAAGHAYPESRIGAGRIQADDAARATVTAKAENSGGLVTLSFGSLVLTNIYSQTNNVILTNHSALAVSYTVGVSNTVSENGVTVTSLVSSVTVPANGSLLVPVRFTADPSLFDRTTDPTTTNVIGTTSRQSLYETSGQVWFKNADLSIHLPYYANVRAGATISAGATTLAVPITNRVVAATVPVAGLSTHPQPVVSVFQLGAVSTNANLGIPLSGLDLLAVGAATDASTQIQFSSSHIYFGIGTAGDWTSLLPAFARFEVQIDTNADGVADFTLVNSSVATSGGDPSDAFETSLSIGSSAAGTLNSFVNVFSAAQRDTAPYNNSVVVLPVTAQSLGLVPGRTQIRYRVRSFGPRQQGGQMVDQTDWIGFDAGRPVLDTTAFGLSGSPFFADGSNIVVKADVGASVANGFVSPARAGLLLLHHFNQTARRIEVVDIQFPPRFFPPVTQANGLVLGWSSATNGLYAVQFATNLSQGFIFQAAAGLSATPPLNTFTNANPTGPIRFYRVVTQ